jgi:hypothetical protein
MIPYYELGDPYLHCTRDQQCVYVSRMQATSRFALAEWAPGTTYPYERTGCPADPNHGRLVQRTDDLHIVLPSARVRDFTWTWYGDCLITDAVLLLFRQAGLTGYQTRPVVVDRVKRTGKRDPSAIPRLHELLVTGKGGDARPESGIRVIYRCERCGYREYSSYRHGILLDDSHSDGSDFLTVNGYPRHILVAERVKYLIVLKRLENCSLAPAEGLRWPEGVPRPEDHGLAGVGKTEVGSRETGTPTDTAATQG